MPNGAITTNHVATLARAIKNYTDAVCVAGASSASSNYTLPVAGASTLGGVKIGVGLEMQGDSLNVTMTAGDSYTLPTASATVKGGVKVGTGLEMQGDTLNCTVTPATVFTGAVGLASGASGLVPAPAAGDSEKFLRGDGSWVAVSGGGQSYSVATTTQAGLMSAEDKQHLDAVFQDSADLTDAVVTVVGGKFSPSVDSASDFITYKDSNLPYLYNKIALVMAGETPVGKLPAVDHEYLNGQAYVDIETSNNLKYSITSGNNAVTLATFSSTSLSSFTWEGPYKLSETAGFFITHAQLKNSTYTYDGACSLRAFSVGSDGSVSLRGSVTLGSAASSVASSLESSYVEFLGTSLTDPTGLCFFYNRGYKTYDSRYYKTCNVYKDTGATVTSGTASTLFGTYYNTFPAKNTTGLVNTYFRFEYPTFTFGNGQVTIRTSAYLAGRPTRRQPFIKFYTETYGTSLTAPSSYTTKVCFPPRPDDVNSIVTLSNVSPTSNSSPKVWLEDDGNLIAGVWRTCHGELYAVTFKPGVYDYSAEWFDSCSSVWAFDFYTLQVFKTNKKLSQVIDDFIF